MPSRADQDALLRFCSADRELAALEERTAVEQRRRSRHLGNVRDLLCAQMQAANVHYLPVTIDGVEQYAVLRRSQPRVVVTRDAVMSAIRKLDYAKDLQSSRSASGTLEAWVEAAVRDALAAEQGQQATKVRVSIVRKRPKETTPHAGLSRAMGGGVAAAPNIGEATETSPPGATEAPAPSVVGMPLRPLLAPSTASQLNDTALSMCEAQRVQRELKRRDAPRRKELRAAKKEVEGAVASHLREHDPQNHARRLRIVMGGKDAGRANTATCYLRAQTRTRAGAPTISKALPLIRERLGALREEQGIGATLTWHSFRWLTSPPVLKRVEALVDESLRQLSAPATTSRVVLSSVPE